MHSMPSIHQLGKSETEHRKDGGSSDSTRSDEVTGKLRTANSPNSLRVSLFLQFAASKPCFVGEPKQRNP
jgi:hypothetical protein